MELKNFKQFVLNEDDNSYLEKKVKDEHAAEDHLENEGVIWTDFDFNHPKGVGFNRDGKTVAHYDKDKGRLHIYNNPADYTGDKEVSKFDDEISDNTKDMKKYYDKEGLGTGSDYAKGEKSDLAYAGYQDEDDEEDRDWEDENNWQMDDLPFDEDV